MAGPRQKKKHVCAECGALFNHGIGLRRHQRQTGHKESKVLDQDAAKRWGVKKAPPSADLGSEKNSVTDNRFSPELKAPYGTFTKVMVTLLLVILVQTLQGYLPTETSWTISTQQEEMRRIVEPKLRVVEGPNANYIVSPPLSEGQESLMEFLLEQEGTEVITVTVTSTWPEYFGYSLWVCFGLGVLWLFFTLMKGEWTERLRDEVKTLSLLTGASVCGAYTIAAYLGWVWHDPTSFGLMYLSILSFAAFKNKIPVSRGGKS